MQAILYTAVIILFFIVRMQSLTSRTKQPGIPPPMRIRLLPGKLALRTQRGLKMHSLKETIINRQNFLVIKNREERIVELQIQGMSYLAQDLEKRGSKLTVKETQHQ